MKQKFSYIYGLRDPRDGLVHYIGKSNRPEHRKRMHLKDKKSNEARVMWIDGLLSCGLEPELVILEKVARHDWQESERQWIAHGHKKGWPLVNANDGGGGSHEYVRASYDFMMPFVPSGLWAKFDNLSSQDKNAVCLQTAKAMAIVDRRALFASLEGVVIDRPKLNAALIKIGQREVSRRLS